MAQNTYQQMSDFILANQKIGCSCPVKFSEISDFVIQYLREKDIKEKEKMLNNAGLLDYAKSNPYYGQSQSIEDPFPDPYVYTMIRLF